MQTLKAAGIWLACGLVPLAIVAVGSLPDRDVIWGAPVMPLLMVALFFWFLGGLVMVATWQQHGMERTPG
jgi:lipopolysaccharide export LptBFGC system permease protein LptF